MPFLTKDRILAVQDIPYRDVPVPEWSEDPSNPDLVRVAGLDAKEASSFARKLVQLDGKGNIKEFHTENFLADLLQRCLVDEEFKPLFSKQDLEALGRKSAVVMKRLGEVAQELSGLNEEAQKEAEKKSENPSDGSPTD